jgi:hypothetical protein
VLIQAHPFRDAVGSQYELRWSDADLDADLRDGQTGDVSREHPVLLGVGAGKSADRELLHPADDHPGPLACQAAHEIADADAELWDSVGEPCKQAEGLFAA